MRIKFLSIIVSFLIASIGMSSCLNSDNTYEYSTDATVHAFGLDTVYGKHYKFTIDQVNRLIYNKDSMPVGADTIIDRILIDTFNVTGWVTSGYPTDTVFLIKDSVNLTAAMNSETGMEFNIYAADGITSRKYTLKVNVHKQDPDSLVWKNMNEESGIFSNSVNASAQRSIILNTDLLVYTSNTTAYKTSITPYQYSWTPVSVTNLPVDAKLTSVINFQEKLYMTTRGGDIYSSSNGDVWEKVAGLSTDVVTLLACLPENKLNNQPAIMAGILKNSEGVNQFCTTTGETWNTADTEIVPDGFPTDNIYSTPHTTANGIDKIVITGLTGTTDKQTNLWFSIDGKDWANLSTGSTPSTACPAIANPSILYYGNMFHCFGGKLDAIYSSIVGIAWHKTEKKFLLPAAFKNKGNYSMTVDKNNYIWIVFGGDGTKNEVWRGRLNRLGFKQQ